MAFQINEKMMASDRAIITRNKTERDLLRTDSVKFKPGMIHYISENQKLWLSVEPKRIVENNKERIRTSLEIITDTRLSNTLSDYVGRSGGSNNSLRGTLYSTVATGTAPFNITSTTKVANLNADRVDDMHVDINPTARTIIGRDDNGNAKLANKLLFNGAYIRNFLNEIHLNENNDNNYAKLKSNEITIQDGKLKLKNKGDNPGISVLSSNDANVANLRFNSSLNIWECGLNGSLSEIVTKSLYGHGKGINADMVDSRHVDDTKTDTNSLWTASKIEKSRAPRGFGLGSDKDLIPSNDCNSIVGTGFFSSNGTPTNGASGETGEVLVQQFISNGGAFQRIEYLQSKNVYTRIKAGSTWSNWIKDITSENILNEGVNVITQEAQPTNITNNDTYWFEIV